MSNKFSRIVVNVLATLIVAAVSYFIFLKPNSSNQVFDIASTTPEIVQGEALHKNNIFTFDSFHSSKNISDKFRFEYPENWYNDGQYFSPQKIEYYDLYSVKAPFYFDLILADIYNDTEFKYQINNSKRKSPDTVGKIDGKDFKRYDLIDYGSYGGESAGRVIIYVGPKINIDNKEYYLVFHWEEKPLTVSIPGNDPAIFERVVQSIKFVK